MGDDLQASVLDALGVAVVVSEHGTGTVVAVNDAACELTGFTRDDVVGRPVWSTVLAGEQGEALRPHWEVRAPAGLPAVCEGTLTTTVDGAQLRLVWTVVLSLDDAGAPAHVVLTGVQAAGSQGAGVLGHLVVAANDAACLATDLQGRVTYLSPQAEHLLRRRATDVLARRLPDEWFDPAEVQARAEELGVPVGLAVLRPESGRLERRRREALDLGDLDRRSAGRSTGRPTSTGRPREWTVRRGDDTTFTAALTVQKATSGTRHVGYLVVLDDVSSRDSTHRFLASVVEKDRLATQRLRELEEAKHRLMADVSHELRTPVATLSGFVELLQDGAAGELTEDQARFVDAIARSGDRLRGLTDDLLALAGLGPQPPTRPLVPTDLVGLVAGVLSGQPFEDGPVAVRPDLPVRPVRVGADPRRLAWAVRHLVGNAVKFSPDGGGVDCVVTAPGDRAVIEVADEGPGIPVEEQADVFAPFFRGTAARERHVRGTGLGLSIVASVARDHGGELSVDSTPGRGSTFRLSLPRHEEPA